MLCLNNTVANDLRAFVRSEGNKVSIGGLVAMYNYINSEAGGLIYNAKTLMHDIDKIVTETGLKPKDMGYPIKILNCLLYGLDIIPEEDSVFYELDSNKGDRFEVLFKESMRPDYKKYPEILKVIVKGALSESLVSQILIDIAKDPEYKNTEATLLFKRWDTIYDNIFKNNPDYSHYLVEIGECTIEHMKHMKLTHTQKNSVYENMRVYKMIGDKDA